MVMMAGKPTVLCAIGVEEERALKGAVYYGGEWEELTQIGT